MFKNNKILVTGNVRKTTNTHSQLDSPKEKKMIRREDRKDIPKFSLNTKNIIDKYKHSKNYNKVRKKIHV